MHFLLRQYLAFLARVIIHTKKPYIIGVTGTVGKTTITHLIAQVLVDRFGKKSVGFSRYHYNGEYGLPLSIIGAKTGGKNPILWVWVFFVAMYRLL
jgi:UDP-N-acetylmuramoyl-tripeptide--D-alanyl-D-alanine ligase